MPNLAVRGNRNHDVAGVRDGAVGSSRLMLFCISAAKLPMIIVSSADAHTKGSQRLVMAEGGHEDAKKLRTRRPWDRRT